MNKKPSILEPFKAWQSHAMIAVAGAIMMIAEILITNPSGWSDMSYIGKTGLVLMMLVLAFYVGLAILNFFKWVVKLVEL
jgi:hypothetical protein